MSLFAYFLVKTIQPLLRNVLSSLMQRPRISNQVANLAQRCARFLTILQGLLPPRDQEVWFFMFVLAQCCRIPSISFSISAFPVRLIYWSITSFFISGGCGFKKRISHLLCTYFSLLINFHKWKTNICQINILCSHTNLKTKQLWHNI